jgi:hypothetical protein
LVGDLAAAGTLTRADLDQIIGARLRDADRTTLRSPDAKPAELVDILSNSGVLSPATVVAVLDHERVDAETVAGLIPAIDSQSPTRSASCTPGGAWTASTPAPTSPPPQTTCGRPAARAWSCCAPHPGKSCVDWTHGSTPGS